MPHKSSKKKTGKGKGKGKGKGTQKVSSSEEVPKHENGEAAAAVPKHENGAAAAAVPKHENGAAAAAVPKHGNGAVAAAVPKESWYEKKIKRVERHRKDILRLHGYVSIDSPNNEHKYSVVNKQDGVLTKEEYNKINEYNKDVLLLELSKFYAELPKIRLAYDANKDLTEKITALLHSKKFMCDLKFQYLVSKINEKLLKQKQHTISETDICGKNKLNINVYNKLFRQIYRISKLCVYGNCNIVDGEASGIVEHIVLSSFFGRHTCTTCNLNKCGYEPVSDLHILFMSEFFGSSLRGSCAFTDNIPDGLQVTGTYTTGDKTLHTTAQTSKLYDIKDIKTTQDLDVESVNKTQLNNEYMIFSNIYNKAGYSEKDKQGNETGKFVEYAMNEVGGSTGIMQLCMPLIKDAGIIARALLYTDWLYIPYFNSSRISKKMQSCKSEEEIDYDDFINTGIMNNKDLPDNVLQFDDAGNYYTGDKVHEGTNLHRRMTNKEYWLRWFNTPYWVRHFYVRKQMFIRWAIKYKPTAAEIKESLVKALLQNTFNPFVVCVKKIYEGASYNPSISLSSFLLPNEHPTINTIAGLIEAIGKIDADKVASQLNNYTLYDYEHMDFTCNTDDTIDFVTKCLVTEGVNHKELELFTGIKDTLSFMSQELSQIHKEVSSPEPNIGNIRSSHDILRNYASKLLRREHQPKESGVRGPDWRAQQRERIARVPVRRAHQPEESGVRGLDLRAHQSEGRGAEQLNWRAHQSEERGAGRNKPNQRGGSLKNKQYINLFKKTLKIKQKKIRTQKHKKL